MGAVLLGPGAHVLAGRPTRVASVWLAEVAVGAALLAYAGAVRAGRARLRPTD